MLPIALYLLFGSKPDVARSLPAVCRRIRPRLDTVVASIFHASIPVHDEDRHGARGSSMHPR